MAGPIPIGISSLQPQDIDIILVVVALLVTVRLYRGVKGTKYSVARVYRAPVTYLALLMIGVAELNPSYTDIAAVAVAVIIGYFIGRPLAGGVRFFSKDGSIYYKRSPTIMVIWLISFMARFAASILYPASLILGVIVEVVLAGTTGLIIGEAHHINSVYKAYAAPSRAKR